MPNSSHGPDFTYRVETTIDEEKNKKPLKSYAKIEKKLVRFLREKKMN